MRSVGFSYDGSGHFRSRIGARRHQFLVKFFSPQFGANRTEHPVVPFGCFVRAEESPPAVCHQADRIAGVAGAWWRASYESTAFQPQSDFLDSHVGHGVL